MRPPSQVPSHRALKCFLAAAENGTLFAAAIDLGVSPRAATGLIQTLERAVGYRVFRRTWNGVELTERGRELLPAARRVVEAYREVRAAE